MWKQNPSSHLWNLDKQSLQARGKLHQEINKRFQISNIGSCWCHWHGWHWSPGGKFSPLITWEALCIANCYDLTGTTALRTMVRWRSSTLFCSWRKGTLGYLAPDCCQKPSITQGCIWRHRTVIHGSTGVNHGIYQGKFLGTLILISLFPIIITFCFIFCRATGGQCTWDLTLGSLPTVSMY
jgi:hypothetical protein